MARATGGACTLRAALRLTGPSAKSAARARSPRAADGRGGPPAPSPRARSDVSTASLRSSPSAWLHLPSQEERPPRNPGRFTRVTRGTPRRGVRITAHHRGRRARSRCALSGLSRTDPSRRASRRGGHEPASPSSAQLAPSSRAVSSASASSPSIARDHLEPSRDALDQHLVGLLVVLPRGCVRDARCTSCAHHVRVRLGAELENGERGQQAVDWEDLVDQRRHCGPGHGLATRAEQLDHRCRHAGDLARVLHPAIPRLRQQDHLAGVEVHHPGDVPVPAMKTLGVARHRLLRARLVGEPMPAVPAVLLDEQPAFQTHQVLDGQAGGKAVALGDQRHVCSPPADQDRLAEVTHGIAPAHGRSCPRQHDDRYGPFRAALRPGMGRHGPRTPWPSATPSPPRTALLATRPPPLDGRLEGLVRPIVAQVGDFGAAGDEHPGDQEVAVALIGRLLRAQNRDAPMPDAFSSARCRRGTPVSRRAGRSARGRRRRSTPGPRAGRRASRTRHIVACPPYPAPAPGACRPLRSPGGAWCAAAPMPAATTMTRCFSLPDPP